MVMKVKSIIRLVKTGKFSYRKEAVDETAMLQEHLAELKKGCPFNRGLDIRTYWHSWAEFHHTMTKDQYDSVRLEHWNRIHSLMASNLRISPLLDYQAWLGEDLPESLKRQAM